MTRRFDSSSAVTRALRSTLWRQVYRVSEKAALTRSERGVGRSGGLRRLGGAEAPSAFTDDKPGLGTRDASLGRFSEAISEPQRWPQGSYERSGLSLSGM